MLLLYTGCMSKQFWAVIAIIVVVFVGIFAFSGKSNNKSGNSAATLTQHIEGNGSSGVTLVEYGDYECPFCEAYYPTVKVAVAEFNDKIHFQFRNFPLVNIHPNAFAGARAAEAAGLQGKFWEMHDALYVSSNWQVWSTAKDPTPYFAQFAAGLGLNVNQFKTDFASTKVDDLVNADLNEGYKLNIQGTPTFFIDGKQVQIANSLPAFEKVINAEVAKKQSAAQTH